MFSEVLQLHLPTEFPLAEFEAFVRSARETIPSGSDARREFNGASNLIGWRFRACVEYRLAYLSSWKLTGASASFDKIYSRERDMYGMFASGVSAIESITYACYSVASDPAVLALPFGEKVRRHRSGPKHLAEALDGRSCGSRLLSALNAMLSSDEWRIWTSYRNTMTHRSNIHRIVYASVGSSPPPSKILQFAGSWSHDPLDGDESAFEALGQWLATTATELLVGGEELARAV